MLAKTFAPLLMYFGIAGAAISLFANLREPLYIADWLWWVIERWLETASSVWGIFAAVGFEPSARLTQPLTIAAFILLTAMSVRLRNNTKHSAEMVTRPALHFFLGAVAVSTVISIALTSPSQTIGATDVPDAPLVILLGATAASFYPIAGQGHLIGSFWRILFGLIGILALNELTR
jgi:hypothetical protein